MTSLKQRFLRGVAWSGAGRLLTNIAGIGVTIVLARLLEPDHYGLIGMARVFTGLAQQAQDLGIGQSLIRMERVTPVTQRLAFTYSLAGASLLYAVLFVCADPAADFYNDREVAPVLRVMALMFPLSALFVVPHAMLMRTMTMKRVIAVQTAAILIESAITVSLAWLGFGVWALVSGQLVSLAVQAAGLALACPWSIGIRFRGPDLKELMHFGGNLTLSRFLWYAYSNADFLIVGRMLGTSALGFYTMSWNLARMPWTKLWFTTVNPLVLPLFTRLRDGKVALGPALCKITRYTALFGFPAIVGLGAVADDAVTVALGRKWEAAILPLRLLCLYCLVRSLDVIYSRLLMATGRIFQEVRFNAVCLATLIPGFLIGQRHGVVGVAAVWVLVYPSVVATTLLPQTLRAAELKLSTYLRAITAPALASAVMGLAVYFSAQLPLAPALRLAVRVSGGVLLYAASLRLIGGPWLPQLRALLRDVRQGS